jgi:hypothetical protein
MTTTATLEAPKVTKRKVPMHIKEAADAAEQRSKGLPLDKPKIRARGRREKPTLDAARAAVAEERAKRDAKAEPKAPKAAPKAKAEPKPRKLSAMWVIRTNCAEALATGGKPTVEMISKACTEAGVPKSDGTIQTIISDFMQSYLAMQSVGLVKG